MKIRCKITSFSSYGEAVRHVIFNTEMLIGEFVSNSAFFVGNCPYIIKCISLINIGRSGSVGVVETGRGVFRVGIDKKREKNVSRNALSYYGIAFNDRIGHVINIQGLEIICLKFGGSEKKSYLCKIIY